MGRRRIWAWAGLVCVFCVAGIQAQQDQAASSSGGSAAVAAVPRLIKYSGTVRDARGEPLGSVAVRLTFAVYEEQLGGVALWAETQVVQLDEQGQYSVLLGATRADGLPVELFPAGKARWLGVQVEGRDEDPRVLLVSVPYALKAEDAAKLGGRSASDFVLTEQLKEEVKTQVEAQKSATTTTSLEMLVSNPSILPALTAATSSFTVSNTTQVVKVQQTGTGYGLYAQAPSNIALFGEVTGASGATYGVKGVTPSTTTGAGVAGFNTALTGTAYGILAQTSSTEGTALYAQATAGTGSTIGLWGETNSTVGTGIFAWSRATSGDTWAMFAQTDSAAGTALVVDNTAGGKLFSAMVNGTEKLTVNGSGNVNTSGSVTATSFSGGGAALTNLTAANISAGTAGISVTGNAATATTASGLNCTGCVTNPMLQNSSLTVSAGSGLTGGGSVSLGGSTALSLDPNISGSTGTFSGSNSTQIVSVTQTGSGYGLAASSSGTLGVYGSGSSYGLYGYTSGSYGVYGSGGTYGVRGYGTSYGVYGSGGTYGLYGSSSGPYGVYGSGGSYGLYGSGVYAVWGSSSNYGVVGYGGSYGVYGYGTTYGVYAAGNLGASGTKSAVVALPDDRVVELYAVESPDVWFEDFGAGELRDGLAEVTLDPTFALTVNTEAGYHVFLSPKGDCEGLYVTNETPTGFEVRELRGGKSDVAFDYRIVAKRRGYENVRMDQLETDAETAQAIRQQAQLRPGARRKLVLPKESLAPLARPEAPSPQVPLSK